MSVAMIFLQIFMWGGSILTTASFIPTLKETIKTKNTTSTSTLSYIMFVIEYLFWCAYAVALFFVSHDIIEVVGLIISDGLGAIISFIVLMFKLRNLSKAKHLHMSEVDWYRQYSKQKQAQDKLKKLQIFSEKDLQLMKKEQTDLTNVINSLYTVYGPVVDLRIQESRSYKKAINREITSPKQRLEFFLNVANNAELARIISLIYLDVYEGNAAKTNDELPKATEQQKINPSVKPTV
ncbi:MAG: hypothetical protein LBL60_01155 [Mycoplasmataceae bacterium]|nr:hypothetical protein [Mycoplasmataceae bacterium]